MKRRHFLAQGLGGAALSLAGWSPAAAQRDADAPRLLVVMLRGGLDGLAALAPVGDARYATLRPNIAPKPMLALNADWALHPALPTWHALWQQGQMAAVHSAGLASYSGRSHFEAQDLMEHGGVTAGGWLGRFLRTRPAAAHGGLAGVAIGPFLSFFHGFKKHLRRVEQVMGGLLVLTGLLFLTGQFTRITYWFLETFPGLSQFG